MVNNIVNIVADGNYNVLPDVPRYCQGITIQARTADPVTYHYRNDAAAIYTIKADTEKTLVGKFVEGDILIRADNNVVIEVEYSVGGFTV